MSKHNVTIGRGPAACRSGTMQPFRRLILIITYIKIVLSVFEGLLRRLLWDEALCDSKPTISLRWPMMQHINFKYVLQLS